VPPTDSQAADVASQDGTRLRYRLSGAGETALVFVHGWSCEHGFWKHQVPAFASSHHVVTLDLAGHGESARDRERFTIEAFAADVGAVVEHLDLAQAVLVGHSFGGAISIHAAQLLAPRVRAVVAVDSVLVPRPKPSQRQIAAWLEPLRADFAKEVRSWVDDSLLPAGADPELREWVAERMTSTPASIAIDAVAHSWAHDLRPALAATDVPVRSINSRGLGDTTGVLRGLVPDYACLVLDGVGHFPQLENPSLFNRTLADLLAALGM
jgi:pimeloyl-ACP methyl ester carboxylesterase